MTTWFPFFQREQNTPILRFWMRLNLALFALFDFGLELKPDYQTLSLPPPRFKLEKSISIFIANPSPPTHKKYWLSRMPLRLMPSTYLLMLWRHHRVIQRMWVKQVVIAGNNFDRCMNVHYYYDIVLSMGCDVSFDALSFFWSKSFFFTKRV